MQPKKLDFIDSLRGIAVLLVCFYHMSQIPQPSLAPPGWLAPLVYSGGSGVMLFFVVSAFTLCLSMDSRSKDEQTPIKNYFTRRFFRIAPLFYVWMAIYYTRDIIVFNSYTSPWTILQSLSFTLNLFPGKEAGYVWASWTIGVEMLFYLIFPLIFLLSKSIFSATSILIITLFFRIPWHAALTKLGLPENIAESYYQSSLIYHLPTFMIGVVAYHAYKLIDKATFDKNDTGKMLIFASIASFLWYSYNDLSMGHTVDITIQGIMFGTLLIGLSMSKLSAISNKTTQFIGTISYSIYLSHATIYYFLDSTFEYIYANIHQTTVAFLSCFIIGMLIILPLSYATYRLIELPGNAIAKRIINKFSNRRASVLQQSSNN